MNRITGENVCVVYLSQVSSIGVFVVRIYSLKMSFFDKFPGVSASSNESKHRLFQILSQVKQSISKKRYNHAWQMAAKHYQQNKSILSTEQIYQLCWGCCIAIEKKLHHRLTAKGKKFVPPLTETHIQHLFSLELSLLNLALPELVRSDPQYFNMLEHSFEGLDPRGVAPEDLVFERRGEEGFLAPGGLKRELRKLVKQHLKVCNTVLMYQLGREGEQAAGPIAAVQRIYDGFSESEFPSQFMDFELVKLSVMEAVGLRAGIECQYRLPLGFLAKIYAQIRAGKEDALERYLLKLSQYLVLVLRNLQVALEDVYILASEVQYIVRLVADRFAPVGGRSERKKTHFWVRRGLTIDKDEVRERGSRKGMGTSGKISEKNLDSKNKINRSEVRLRVLAQTALDIINNYLCGRREIKEIMMSYFSEAYLLRLRDCDSGEEIVEGEIVLQGGAKRREVGEQLQGLQRERRGYKTLTAMLQQIKHDKKSSADDQHQQDNFKLQLPTKPQGTFVVRNIQRVGQPSALKGTYYSIVGNLLRNIEAMQERKELKEVNEVKEVKEGEEMEGRREEERLEQFQVERLNKIKAFKQKLRQKDARRVVRSKSLRSQELQVMQAPASKDSEVKRIRLLDEVVRSTINSSLGLTTKQPSRRSFDSSSSNPVLCKLQGLRLQVQSLSTERKLMVQKLVLRQNDCRQFRFRSETEGLLALTGQQLRQQKENQEEIGAFVATFNRNASQRIREARGLLRLEAGGGRRGVGVGAAPVQPKTKLRLGSWVSQKWPEVTFQQVQEGYRRLEGGSGQDHSGGEMALSSQFDRLRRDVAKNQFANQNQKKANARNKCNTILEMTHDDEQEGLRG